MKLNQSSTAWEKRFKDKFIYMEFEDTDETQPYREYPILKEDIKIEDLLSFIATERRMAQREIVKKIEEFYVVNPKIDQDYKDMPPSLVDVKYVVQQALELNFTNLLASLKAELERE